jgi:hypothetical protein
MANTLKRKSLINLLILLLIFILLYVGVTITTLNLTKQIKKTTEDTTPTQILSENKYTNNHPNVEYDPQGQQDIADKINHRTSLSQNDQTVRTQLINDIGNKSGTVYESPQVKITYLQSGDFFQAEILVPDIQTAKADANLWLRNQGLTQQGICNLPLQFYLNYDISTQLRNNHVIFSPLPNGC